MTVSRKRTAVLISGRGSNMLSLIEAAKDPAYPAEIVLVVSNRPDAGGIARAESFGIPAKVLDHKAFGRDREAFEHELDAMLAAEGIELVVLAGFMRLMTPWLVERWNGRMINIHPALLPSFKGLHTHERALEAGVRLHGATVHFVSPGMDEGAIIAQGAVPVLSGDTPEALGARVLTIEHQIYPQALALVASGQVQLEDGKAVCRAAAEDAEGRLTAPGW